MTASGGEPPVVVGGGRRLQGELRHLQQASGHPEARVAEGHVLLEAVEEVLDVEVPAADLQRERLDAERAARRRRAAGDAGHRDAGCLGGLA